MKHNAGSTLMNMTNAEYFTFNVDNSSLITAQTELGKTLEY